MIEQGALKASFRELVTAEAGDKSWWAAFEWEPGKPADPVTGSPFMCLPNKDMQAYAFAVVRALNKHLPMGGTWIAVWCDPAPIIAYPTRFLVMFKDADGDVIVSIDSEWDFPRLAEAGPLFWLENAFDGLKQYADIQKDVEIKPEQTRKAAQGQDSVDRDAQAPFT